ncbi:hypothetical protein GCM10007933_02710 [Zoogloea oryzae]|uniref:Uncharacterized protein n=1 Tax=Zoogloea oryzae TaxID=310767 RepID=A0ABQ6F6C9_9RHOO|nr:hypothetical protein [Zoogloea oryzae]GLT20819.1 hypothetical protein GCM10007933_02710 [Zoogloea oryzae]
MRIAQHPDDDAVDRFAEAMKAKLAAGRAMGRHSWINPEAVTDAELTALMTQHMTTDTSSCPPIHRDFRYPPK